MEEAAVKDARELAHEIVVSEFKELCDKHADTCLCGKVRDAIAAAIRNARAETWKSAAEYAYGVSADLALEFEARAKAEREGT